MDEATGYYEAGRRSSAAELLARDRAAGDAHRSSTSSWREHLYEMDYLQEGIDLRAMGQRDPLTEWQREGFDMFEP